MTQQDETERSEATRIVTCRVLKIPSDTQAQIDWLACHGIIMDDDPIGDDVIQHLIETKRIMDLVKARKATLNNAAKQ